MFGKKFSKGIFTLGMVLLASSVIMAGCGQPKAEKLNLFVAAGLKKPMDTVIDRFQKQTGAQVVVNYAASGGLYTQIKEGQPCDLYFSADWIYIDKVKNDGKLAEANKFLKDDLVLIVAKSAQEKVKTVEDLNKPDVTVGICDTQAPVGTYSEAALKKMGVWDKLSTSGNLKARPSTVNQLAIMVQKDELDSGLIFRSVANAYRLGHTQVIPTEYSGEIVFGNAIIKGGNEALAKKFLTVLKEKDNISEFTKLGWQAY